jgi:hypothetical protein
MSDAATQTSSIGTAAPAGRTAPSHVECASWTSVQKASPSLTRALRKSSIQEEYTAPCATAHALSHSLTGEPEAWPAVSRGQASP